MSLKFPNARLFLHQLLAGDRLTGAQAIAEGACEFGLIAEGSAGDVLQCPDQSACCCAATARNVVKKHFEERQKDATLPGVDHEQVWSAIERNLANHPHIEQFAGIANCHGEGPASACRNHAPALFDLVLQHLMRYP